MVLGGGGYDESDVIHVLVVRFRFARHRVVRHCRYCGAGHLVHRGILRDVLGDRPAVQKRRFVREGPVRALVLVLS
jgi:hypothetical protein